MTEKQVNICEGFLYKDDTSSNHIVVVDKKENGKIIMCSCFYKLPIPTEQYQPFKAKLI